MRACALIVIVLAGGGAPAVTPLVAVLLVAAGVLLTALACVAIAAIVRLAGARPARLLDRNGGGHVHDHPDR